MTRTLVSVAALIAAGLGTTAASAAPNRTAVSVSGTDSGVCPPAAPCRTIAYALTQTTAGGEMFILSSGGYGPFTVTQAVTITAPTGTLAAVSAGSGVGITISAGPTDLVLLSGFLLDGLGTGTVGVQVNSAGSVSLTGSQITGFTGQGINYVPATSSGIGHLTLTNSSIYANPIAINAQPSGNGNGSTTAQISITGSSFSSGPITLSNASAGRGVYMQINDSTIRYGSSVVVNDTTSVFASAQITHTAFVGVANALTANGSAAEIYAGSSSFQNIGTIGVANNSGTITSYGNNEIGRTVGGLGTFNLGQTR